MKEHTPVFEIFPFDFSDEKLIYEAIDLLNEGTEARKHNFEFWKWRFNKNPFGQSIGWYAREMTSGDLAGILLWWPWKFITGNHEKLFYQAINGKTACKYRNKKIFFRLNTIAIQYFQTKNFGLFGYANENSYPNYRNIGWKLISRVHPLLIPVSPINSLFRLIFNKKSVNTEKFDPDQMNMFFHNQERKSESQIKTNWDSKILTWRFLQHPIHNYCLFIKNTSLIIYRMKKRNRFIEAQIVFSDIDKKADYQDFIKHLKENQIDFISYFGYNTFFAEVLSRKLFRFTLKKDLYFIVNNSGFFQNRQLRFEMAESDSQ